MGRMTPREVVRQTIRFEGVDRIPYAFTPEYGSDFADVCMNPSPDARPKNGVDEWGCVWENIGVSSLGQVKQPALTNWADWESLNIPDIRDPKRWGNIKSARQRAGDRFLLAWGISLYERVHFLRGLEDTWVDIHANPEKLGRLITARLNVGASRRSSTASQSGRLGASVGPRVEDRRAGGYEVCRVSCDYDQRVHDRSCTDEPIGHRECMAVTQQSS